MQDASGLRFDIQRLEGFNSMKIHSKSSSTISSCFYSQVPKIDFISGLLVFSATLNYDVFEALTNVGGAPYILMTLDQRFASNLPIQLANSFQCCITSVSSLAEPDSLRGRRESGKLP